MFFYFHYTGCAHQRLGAYMPSFLSARADTANVSTGNNRRKQWLIALLTKHLPVGRYIGRKKLDLRVCKKHRFHPSRTQQTVAENAVYLGHTLVFEISVRCRHGCLTNGPNLSPIQQSNKAHPLILLHSFLSVQSGMLIIDLILNS